MKASTLYHLFGCKNIKIGNASLMDILTTIVRNYEINSKGNINNITFNKIMQEQFYSKHIVSIIDLLKILTTTYDNYYVNDMITKLFIERPEHNLKVPENKSFIMLNVANVPLLIESMIQRIYYRLVKLYQTTDQKLWTEDKIKWKNQRSVDIINAISNMTTIFKEIIGDDVNNPKILIDCKISFGNAKIASSNENK